MENKKRIAISAECCVGLPQEMLEEYDIHTVPLTITMGDESLYENEVTNDMLFDYVKRTKDLPKTSAVNQEQYREHFAKLLKEYDGIIHFSLSSEMSSTYSNASLVAKEFKNVYVIDTKSASVGIGLPTIYAAELVKEGKLDIEEIYFKALSRVPNIQASFILEKVYYLYKGGRCNSLQLLGANILKLRPQIQVKDGKMYCARKHQGSFEKSVIKYADNILKSFDTPDPKHVFLSFTSGPDQKLVDEVTVILKEKGFENIHVVTTDSTISSHCGPNGMGILYMNDKDFDD